MKAAAQQERKEEKYFVNGKRSPLLNLLNLHISDE